jgi:hypothetical protein
MIPSLTVGEPFSEQKLFETIFEMRLGESDSEERQDKSISAGCWINISLNRGCIPPSLKRIWINSSLRRG